MLNLILIGLVLTVCPLAVAAAELNAGLTLGETFLIISHAIATIIELIT